HKIPVTPRGAGTGLSGVTVPLHGGIVLDLCKMNKILKISIKDRLAVVQPGVVYARLEEALKSHGFFFPPDPASSKVATLGGNVATNAGGIRGAKYGTTRDYVLGLELVLADGSILRTGAGVMKCTSGYDLVRLFVGSEGTLAVVTEITLKINPKPQAISTCTATFNDIRLAGNAVNEIMHSGIIPSALEILDDQCIMCLNRAGDLNMMEAAATLLVETDGYTREETDFQMAKVIKALKGNGAEEITQADSTEEAEKLWAARKGIYGAVSRLYHNIIVEDITVPISKMVDMLIAIQDIRERYNVVIPVLGHIGDGNLHPYLTYDSTNKKETERIKLVEAAITELAIKLGGTLTGEHGIGVGKACFMPLEHEATAIELMSNLKKMLDPNNILNPGKMGLNL
ncbi:MAG: FAD-binding protein, partial [Deltaproteobacteria bacterium]|nr:FAD-binding protein [Deltaproteobacteria bacterium]